MNIYTYEYLCLLFTFQAFYNKNFENLQKLKNHLTKLNLQILRKLLRPIPQLKIFANLNIRQQRRVIKTKQNF